MMRIKKVPCLAWVRWSQFPENIGKVVQVVSRATDHPINGEPAWNCKSEQGYPCANRNTGEPIPGLFHEFTMSDKNLTPINDPGLDVSDTDIVAPVLEKQWEFPKEKENV